MKKPLLLIACLLLAGCTDADWNRVANYGGMGSADADADVEPESAPQTVVAAPQPMAAAPMAPANSDFCKSVATQDATTNGFDPATQARVLQRSYVQCVTIYNR